MRARHGILRVLGSIAAVLLATGTAPASAQQTPGPIAAEIDITFAPPLDTPLRFRITRARVRSERPAVAKASWIEQLRFTRNGDGFILAWHMEGESLPPEMRTPSIAPMVAPFTREPIAFDLDADGSILRVRDWQAVLPRLLQVIDSLPKGSAQDKEQAHILARVRAMFEALDAEQAVGVLLKNIVPVLHWGGVSMRVGEAVETTEAQPVPILGGTVARTTRTTLTAVDRGEIARIQMRSETDGASLRQLVTAFAERFGLHDDPVKKAQMERELAAMEQLEMVDTSTVTVDLATGLSRTLDYRREAEVEGKTRSEDLRIEWLR